jgi:uncharacterized protein DUF2299
MDWNWLWQVIVGHWVEELLVVGSGVMLPLVRKYLPAWKDAIVYALLGITMASLLIYTFTGHAVFYDPASQITTDNIEAVSRGWLLDLGYGFTPVPENPKYYFGLRVTLQDGRSVTIVRPTNEWNHYLTFNADIVFPADRVALIKQMSKEQAIRLNHTLDIELDQARTSFVVAFPVSMHLEAQLPITNDMSEASFINEVNQLDEAEGIVMETVDAQIGK